MGDTGGEKRGSELEEEKGKKTPVARKSPG